MKILKYIYFLNKIKLNKLQKNEILILNIRIE